MVHAYKVLRDISLVKLDEFFCEFKLRGQDNMGQKEKYLSLVAKKKLKKKKEKKRPHPSCRLRPRAREISLLVRWKNLYKNDGEN